MRNRDEQERKTQKEISERRKKETNMRDYEKMNNYKVRSRKSKKQQDEQYNHHQTRRLTCPSVLLGNPAISYLQKREIMQNIAKKMERDEEWNLHQMVESSLQLSL